mmetsp:Transcript_6734/g.15581  ORF Transcript_6734/g.15581 Transcript_6734/m.15581 type:complete len:972 (+) Transcript_6734:97-3012(+)
MDNLSRRRRRRRRSSCEGPPSSSSTEEEPGGVRAPCHTTRSTPCSSPDDRDPARGEACVGAASATAAGGRRRRTRPAGGLLLGPLLLAAVLLSAGASEAPPGLLFASELGAEDPSSARGFRPSYTVSSSAAPEEGNVGGADGARRHPIRRIYHDNLPARRELHEGLKSIPYWETGLLGDPAHRLEYDNHPYDVMRRARERKEAEGQRRKRGGVEENVREDGADEEDDRDLQEDGAPPSPDPFRPIRIHFHTESLDEEYDGTNQMKIDFVKNVILPGMADFWSSALSVVPVSGNLFVSTAELQGRAYCGDTEFSRVPVEHISTGVPDADLVLYVSAAPSSRFCGPSTLAVAVACNFDQFDRPTAGSINFCLDQIELDDRGRASDSVMQDNIDVAVHEAAHVLGMSSNSYRFFWDPDNGRERTARPFTYRGVICVDGVERNLILPDDNTMKFFIATSGQRYASIVTPTVATVARNQFNCPELNGAQLENQPTGENSCTGDHWDERMYYPEALSGVISPTTVVLSPLTLALLEDSGWYRANYTRANVSPWGHGVGCDFVSQPCLVGGGNGRDGSLPSYSRGFFCNKASSRGCSPAYTHKMACTVIDFQVRGTYLPDKQFQYFADAAVGGPREADYCPVYGSVYSGMKPEELDCRIPSNDDAIDVIYSEEYGDNSMCFETTSGEGRCYNARCIYDDFNLQLRVDGKWYTCEEDFQTIEVSTLSGAFGTTVTCPRLSSVCPDMFCPVNCAGRGVCNFEAVDNVTGDVRPRCECFDPEDTSAGCSDTFVLDGKYLRDGTSLTDQIKDNFFEPLVAVFVDHPDTWTTASWAWAAALFVVFIMMVLCICSSFWPEKRDKRAEAARRRRRKKKLQQQAASKSKSSSGKRSAAPKKKIQTVDSRGSRALSPESYAHAVSSGGYVSPDAAEKYQTTKTRALSPEPYARQAVSSSSSAAGSRGVSSAGVHSRMGSYSKVGEEV